MDPEGSVSRGVRVVGTQAPRPPLDMQAAPRVAVHQLRGLATRAHGSLNPSSGTYILDRVLTSYPC